MLRVLVIDTCDEATVALAEDGQVVRAGGVAGRRASELLLPVLRETLAEVGWTVGELAGIGVVRGPGSFTGVRVGLSVAKGLSEGAGVPLVAVSRLEVLARRSGVAGAMAVLRAGRGEGFFRVGEEEGLAGMEVLRERAVAQALTVVCEAGEAEGFVGAAVQVVSGLGAEAAVPLVMERLRAGQTEDGGLLDALYLRRTEQELLERQRAHRVLKAEA